MVRTPPVNRLPNNAMSENDIIMTQQQAHNLKMAQTASDGFRFPQNTDIVDDDEQIVQDVIAEINAETNRAESSHSRQQMMPSQNFVSPPTQGQMQMQMQMHQVPPSNQMQSPPPPHVQHVMQSPPQPQHPQQQQVPNQVYYANTQPYAQSPPPQLPPQPSSAMVNPYSSFQDPLLHPGGDRNVRIETYQEEKSYINRIIETITSNIKTFLILSIIIVLLRVPVVRHTIETLTRRYVPVPYIEVVVDIILAYLVFLILSSKFA
jgi:hypothetical protein